jgi:hypothetical protein
MAGTAVLYAALASIALIAPEPTSLGAWIIVAIAVGSIALPLAFRRLPGFRIACVTVAVLVVPVGIVGFFIYWPAALPLTLASTPLPNRCPITALLVATLLLATPWMTSPLWL